MHIDPFYLYLILQLDDIKNTAGFFAFLFCVVGAVGTAIIGTSMSLEERVFNTKKPLFASIFSLLFGLMLITVNTLLPTTERMAMIVVIPAVANNEDVQTEARELYDLAKRGLTKLAEEEGEEESE
jgi:hypothetical protein